MTRPLLTGTPSRYWGDTNVREARSLALGHTAGPRALSASGAVWPVHGLMGRRWPGKPGLTRGSQEREAGSPEIGKGRWAPRELGCREGPRQAWGWGLRRWLSRSRPHGAQTAPSGQTVPRSPRQTCPNLQDTAGVWDGTEGPGPRGAAVSSSLAVQGLGRRCSSNAPPRPGPAGGVQVLPGSLAALPSPQEGACGLEPRGAAWPPVPASVLSKGRGLGVEGETVLSPADLGREGLLGQGKGGQSLLPTAGPLLLSCPGQE